MIIMKLFDFISFDILTRQCCPVDPACNREKGKGFEVRQARA